ncbi:MAG: transposase [Neptuniibacter caesariensis]|uniref:Transposase n=1 Tax=Neptuniibacter caesariensis TaxID=207954 RepID=A0A2G6JQP4_NEPCE|nr:MAG: transposase [Neptuniibacter caesariensis]
MLKGNLHALRKGRSSCENQIYHVVLTTHKRRRYFSDPTLARHAVLSLKRLSTDAVTLCFVVMPDHIHWLMQLKGKKGLSETVRLLKIFIGQGAGSAIFQYGFYDHAIRKEESLVDVARYIVMNPVRAGLCRSVRDYSWWDCIYL